MTIVLIAHAHNKQQLDQVYSILKNASPLNLVNGLVDLPEGTSARLGESTPKEFYEDYHWHERIEVADDDAYKNRSFYKEEPPLSARKIYTTDPSHPLICRAEGQTWRAKEYVEGLVTGLYFTEDELTEVLITDRCGKVQFCKEFAILAPTGIVESDGWWKVFPPFLSGQIVYFRDSWRNQKPPVALVVKRCEFLQNLHLTGYWRVTATQTVGLPDSPREIGVVAASWMFAPTPEILGEDGYCYQVRQYYHDYAQDPGYTTAVTGGDLPCYATQEEAIAFLESTTFPGGVIRHVKQKGLDTGITAGVVFERFEGNRDYQKAREENALVLAAAARKAHQLIRKHQSKCIDVGATEFDTYF